MVAHGLPKSHLSKGKAPHVRGFVSLKCYLHHHQAGQHLAGMLSRQTVFLESFRRSVGTRFFQHPNHRCPVFVHFRCRVGSRVRRKHSELHTHTHAFGVEIPHKIGDRLGEHVIHEIARVAIQCNTLCSFPLADRRRDPECDNDGESYDNNNWNVSAVKRAHLSLRGLGVVPHSPYS